MGKRLWGIAFPCILEGLGTERVIAEAADMGQSQFIICSSIYKGYRLVMPRHPRQVYQLETGLMFYPINEAAYKGCKIRPAGTRDYAGRDFFKEALKAGEKHNVAITGWLACFANGRVANEYPETAVQNLYGSRDRLFLCFNNQDTQQFVKAMFRDLASQYPLATFMADKIPQSMMELDAISGRIDPLLRLVGSICFCDDCMALAKKDGIDLAEAKRIALRVAEATRKVPQFVRDALADELQGDQEVPNFLLEEPLIVEVLRWRINCVARFMSEARDLVRSIRPQATVSVCLVPPTKIGHDATQPRVWLAAESYRRFAQVADTIHSVIHWNPDVVEYDTRRARDLVDLGNRECELCLHVAAYGRRRPEEMPALYRAAFGQGADSMAFFCHDLMDERMMAALKQLPG
jgi:hypothetical protein